MEHRQFFASLLIAAAVFVASCRTPVKLIPVEGGRYVVPCPEKVYSVSDIKKYVADIKQSDPVLMDIYDRIDDGIFAHARKELHLKKCPVEPMFRWMNFCEGLKAVRGATALTHGYRDRNGYHLILLVDSAFMYEDEAVLAELMAHEMVHAYCDHWELPTGISFHEGWFDTIASKIEELSYKALYKDHFYSSMRNIFRE